MQYRNLGASGLQVPVLSFGTGTFGGEGPLFSAWGNSSADEARRLIDICLDAGVTLFDTADVYSNGGSEERLGAAIKGRRDRLMISSKTSLPMGDGPADAGSSRQRLTRAVDASLTRLGTDHIDLLQLHAFDAGTPIDEVLYTLDMLVRAGKVNYVGVSNFSGWQLMKSLGIAAQNGWPRYAAHQVYYSLIGRDYEWELMPLGLDQGVGALVWSPLGWGRLTVAGETGKSIPQVALAWLLTRPTVSSVIIGARNEVQLRDNLGAVGWSLTTGQIARLNTASDVMSAYPYYPYRTQQGFARLNPPPV